MSTLVTMTPSRRAGHHSRISHALLVRSRTREQIDAAVEASNGSDEILRLRALGLEISCARAPCINRNGKEAQRGIYSFTTFERRKRNTWLSKRRAGSIDAALAGLIFAAVVFAILLTGVI